MSATLHRETFIALRARRQGYRIASEILNPPVSIPSAPIPPVPQRDPAEVLRNERWGVWPAIPIKPVSKLTVAILIVVDAAIIAGGFWLARL